MRPLTASHCVFAKWGHRLGNFTLAPRRFPRLAFSQWRVMCSWCVKTKAERGAAVGRLAFCISPNGPSNRRRHRGASEIRNIDTPTVAAYMRSMFENTGRVGCGGGRLAKRILPNGPSKGRRRDWASEIRYIGMSTVAAYADLVRGKLSLAGCGVRQPRNAHSQNWTLESASAPPGSRI